MPNIDLEELLATAELTPAHDFLRRIRDTVWNRCAVQLKSDLAEENDTKSFVGLVPRATRIGDVICILYRCSIPLVLRERQTSGSNTSRLLTGEASVHRVMNGSQIKHT
jgi:hypothetical protein